MQPLPNYFDHLLRGPGMNGPKSTWPFWSHLSAGRAIFHSGTNNSSRRNTFSRSTTCKLYNAPEIHTYSMTRYRRSDVAFVWHGGCVWSTSSATQHILIVRTTSFPVPSLPSFHPPRSELPSHCLTSRKRRWRKNSRRSKYVCVELIPLALAYNPDVHHASRLP